MRKLFILAALLGTALPGAVLPARAEGRMPPVANETVRKECGACHMVFQPQFLPQRSWRRVMDTLSDHFGEDASLPEATRKEISDYLLGNAADVSQTREGLLFAASIANGETPIRITEVPRWVRAHWGEVPERFWTDPRVRSKANCTACHRGAASGWYGDD